MLSYRHAFHAGNHADVLKHAVLVQLLRYLSQKEVALNYIDTHAGAGVYALHRADAAKNAEYESGIARLWGRKDLPESLADYVNIVREFNGGEKLRYYPGSPWIAETVLRDKDRLRLFELHPSESRILTSNVRKLEENARANGRATRERGKRIMIEPSDGFDGIKALLPPPSKRACVLIDPPYEVKDDYRRVTNMLNDALERFPAGTYAIWYPALVRRESQQLPQKLKRLPVKDWLHVSLSVSKPHADGQGLRESGMFIINPPWTLEKSLEEMMPYLRDALQQDEGASYVLESKVV